MKGRFLRRFQRGGALLVTLAFVVLVTVAILAFVAHTQSALLAARATVSRMESDNLMTSALESTLSDLRMEMLAGALKDSARTNFDSLDPLVVRRRWAMVPSRLVSANLPATGFENLVKQSLYRKNFYSNSSAIAPFISYGPASVAGSRRATTVNTITPSADGRMLSAARWDQVALASQSFPDNALPDWIYVTRGGVPSDGSTLVASNASRSALDNTNYVVGRYAYQIYDVGGLLDLNTAGLPTSLASKAPAKGGVQWADLTAIGFSTNAIKDLMDFRFSATKSYSDLPDKIRYISERAGFLSPMKAGADSDGFFYTRQDLLRFILRQFGKTLKECNPAERELLASVTQDSRFLTSPSWNPPALGTTERPAIKKETKGGNNSYGKDDLFNPVIVTNTVTTSFTRPRLDDLRTTSSGLKEVAAKAGEPYVLSRFPLDRLQLIKRDATAKRNEDSLIYRYFGLSRSSPDEPWVYNHGTSGTSGDSVRVLYLDEVRKGTATDDGVPRELDFVEMLKVAISSGSLGKSAGTQNGGGSAGNDRDQRVNYQLVQILANIIDQYDEDGFPTHIQFDDEDFYGVENLPYLQRVKMFIARLLEDSYDALDSEGKPLPYQPYSVVWLPEVWNPHDKNSSVPSNGPTKFRVVADTAGFGFPMQYRDSTKSGNYTSEDVVEYDPEKNYVELTAAAVARSYEPTMINRIALGTPSIALNDLNRKTSMSDVDWSTLPRVDSDLAGIASSTVFVKLTVPKIGFRYFSNSEHDGLSFAMEYQDPNTLKWHRYMRRQLMRAGVESGTDAPRGRSKNQSDYEKQNNGRILAFDPRTDRFSTYRLQERDSDPEAYADNKSLRPDQGYGYGLGCDSSEGDRQSPAEDENGDYGWKMGFASLSTESKSGTKGTIAYAMGTILQNTAAVQDGTTAGTRYTDPDGVLRSGDGILASGIDPEGQMYWPFNYDSRPIILNRAFRSVAELGYVFRDTPCRSLDLFTENSGDSNLLDFFCIDETPDDAITSARVSANTRNVKVLESLLKGALRDPVSGDTLSDDRAKEAAQALVNLTTSSAKGPLLNRSELATKFLSGLPLPADKSERIKRQREVFVRALADSLETRTWNLLIDMFAQTGRIPNGKTAFSDFRVESERHVWVHLAIDRVTGKVINLNVESVHD